MSVSYEESRRGLFDSDVDPYQSMTYEERREKRMNDSRRSTKDSLRLLDECAEIGIATNDRLDEQGETIQNIKKNMDVIEMHMAASDRILRGMGSWWGTIQNAFTTDTSYVPKSKNVAEIPKKNDNSTVNTSNTTVNTSPRKSNTRSDSHSYKGSTAYDDWHEDTERDLDEMIQKIGVLKQLGREMGDRIEDHNRELDKLAPRVERVDEHLRKNTRKVRALK
eukprot:TRINITY_DN797_c0_g1_i1.p1 TRINITY_DN797_c0_g1~~TRINITY_DN797_c0_g1_i1.p1  ORF type:complete len:222 (+),score=60.94 TRINITY_DN797_c0_g1_i1:118-783(+)